MKLRYINFRETISGLVYKIPVLEHNVTNPKAKIYLQSGIHASEINGIAVIRKIQEFILNENLRFHYYHLKKRNVLNH